MSEVAVKGGLADWGINKNDSVNKKEPGNEVKQEAKVDSPKDAIKEALKNTIKDTSETKIPGKDTMKPLPDDILNKFGKLVDPIKLIDGLRKSDGASRDEGLVGFQSKLDKMSSSDLKSGRDHLVKLMADPNNKDDEFLGVLLNTVNKEIDSRGKSDGLNFPKPFPGDIFKPSSNTYK